jgi:hypothetical protein
MDKQICRFKIIRRTSQYNKHIKWYAETFTKDAKLVSSYGYRTEREARQSVIPRENPFPIGDRLIQIELQEIK